MNFLHEWGFDVKEGRSQEFQKWLTDNEEKLALESPEGCEYFGTFAAVHTSEKNSGAFRTIFRMNSYAGQDAFSAAMKEGGAFARMMEELTSYMDQSNNSNWSEHMLRRVSDTAIWGE